jgi:microsomal dipeptidase-like Zn-dependent dipeptidase
MGLPRGLVKANYCLCPSVGLGSDYDGIDSTPVGLEDVSKYPALVGVCSLKMI